MTALPNDAIKAKVCDRDYQGIAFTAQMINGKVCCVSCKQPIKEHKS